MMHDEPAVPPGMQRYYLCFLQRGPAYTTEESPELARLHAAHLAHLTALLEAGHSLVSGPVLDAGDLRGLTLFRTASRAEAAALAAQDPAVQAGRFVVAIYPWLVPRGDSAGRLNAPAPLDRAPPPALEWAGSRTSRKENMHGILESPLPLD